MPEATQSMIHVKYEQRLKIYTSRDQNNARSLAKISLDLNSEIYLEQYKLERVTRAPVTVKPSVEEIRKQRLLTRSVLFQLSLPSLLSI